MEQNTNATAGISSENVAGAGTLADIWRACKGEMVKHQSEEQSKAREIAKRLCDEKLKTMSWMEMETYVSHSDRTQLLFEVTISNEDSDSVRNADFAMSSTNGNDLIRAAAEAYILASNRDDLDVKFSYSIGQCAGNQFMIVVHKMGQGGDK